MSDAMTMSTHSGFAHVFRYSKRRKDPFALEQSPYALWKSSQRPIYNARIPDPSNFFSETRTDKLKFGYERYM